MAEGGDFKREDSATGSGVGSEAVASAAPAASKNGGRGKAKLIVLLVVAVVMIVAVVAIVDLVLSGNSSKVTKEDFLTSAALEKSIEIDNLSAAEFVYNGIAEHYRDENEERDPLLFWESDDPVDYRICYKASVKAGITMSDVKFDVDNGVKKVRVSLPDITLTSNVDPNGMQFIPEGTDANPQEIIGLCEADVENEAQQSGELYEMAQENLRSVIEALTLPIVEAQGYTIEWIEGE